MVNFQICIKVIQRVERTNTHSIEMLSEKEISTSLRVFFFCNRLNQLIFKLFN